MSCCSASIPSGESRAVCAGGRSDGRWWRERLQGGWVGRGLVSCRWMSAIAAAAMLIGAGAARAQFTCATATPVAVGTPFSGTTAGSPGDGLAGLCAPTSNAVWHLITPAASGNYTISLCGSTTDTVATLYAACGTTPLACDDNTCSTGALIVAPLTAGISYRLRVATLQGAAAGPYTLQITAPAANPPANNACGAATALTLNIPQRGANLGANGNDQSNCGLLDTSDVWYSFIPSLSGTHRVEVCATGFAPVLTIHTTCIGGTSSTCSTEATTFAPCPGGIAAGVSFQATSGRAVLVRVAGQRASFGAFDIVAYGPRGNDACVSATPVQVGTPVTGSTSPILATEGSVNCAVSGADVWHSFIPQDTGPHLLQLCGSSFDTVLSLHSACPGTPGAGVIACNDDGCSTQSSMTLQLQAGVRYLLRVAGKGAAPAWGSYTLLAARLAPPNDLCTGPATITLGVPVMGSSIGASGTDLTPSCGVADSRDVWYSFTPPATANYEIHTCGSVMDTTLSVFNSCAVNPQACGDDDPGFCGAASSNSRITLPLVAGQTVLIRVAGVGNTEGDFHLAVARTPPLNDACTGPQTLPALTLINGTTTGASGSGAGTCVTADAADVWYTFTPPTTTFWRVETCGSVLRGSISIQSACPPAVPIACGGSGFSSCPTGLGAAATAYLMQGTPYLIRVANEQGSPVGGAFQVQARSVAPPNDACENAAPLGVGETVFGANVGADKTPGLASCGVGDTRDVWFSLVVPATGTYQIGTCATGGTLDTVLTLHEACGGPAVACSDNQTGCDAGGSLVAARLIAGVKYLVRIAGSGGTEGTFFVNVAVTAPANDTCARALAVGTGDVPFDTLAATTDAAFLDLTCTIGFNLINNDVWFRFTPVASGPVTATVCGANFDTAMAVSNASGGCPTGLYSVVGCNDDSACIPNVPQITPQSEVRWNAVAGTPYFIRVGSRVGAVGAGVLRVSGTGVTCPCDWNGVGGLDIQDLLDFIEDWISGQADFDGSGQTSLEDVFEFVSCYVGRPGGC